MPEEERIIKAKEVAKQGALVIPLDALRSLDNVTYTAVSGTSGVVYTIVSGQRGYITQALFSELSGTASEVQLKDTRGSGLCVRIPVAANTCVSWDSKPACGPVQSGITVESPQFGGDITVLVHVDPRREE